jgi:hypothetical protein
LICIKGTIVGIVSLNDEQTGGPRQEWSALYAGYFGAWFGGFDK